MDATNKLFSLNGESPTFLPSRLRLSNGFTRYIHNISEAELSSLGYTGPYERPADSETEYFTWNKDSLSFVPNQRTSFVSLEENREAKVFAQKLLDTLELPQGAVSEYSDAYSSSVESLRTFINSDSLLGFSDLPSLPATQFKTNAQLQELADLHFANLSGCWKETYTYNGQLVPAPDTLFADLITIPSDWVVTNSEPPAYPSGYTPGEDTYFDGNNWTGGSWDVYEVGDI